MITVQLLLIKAVITAFYLYLQLMQVHQDQNTNTQIAEKYSFSS